MLLILQSRSNLMQIPGTIPIFQEITVLNGVILETFIILICNPERTNVLCLCFLCRQSSVFWILIFQRLMTGVHNNLIMSFGNSQPEDPTCFPWQNDPRCIFVKDTKDSEACKFSSSNIILRFAYLIEVNSNCIYMLFSLYK